MRGRSCDATGSHVHTSISAAPDDLRSQSGHAQLQCTQSMFACIDQHVDQSMFASFVVFESVCA